MISLKTLMEETDLLPDGNLRITDVNDITPAQWERINRIIVQKGHNMRGGDDCKRAVTNFLQNPNNKTPNVIRHDIYDKWVETIATVLHLKSPIQAKPKAYDCAKVLRAAARMFGLTHDLNQAGYILPNGNLLALTTAGYGRDRDHREIASVYLKLGIKVPSDEARSGTVYMQSFCRDCRAIRIGGSQNACHLYSEPTRQQANQLINFFSMYDGNICLDVESLKYGLDGQSYPNGTNPARILRDIIQFYKNGQLPQLPLHRGPSFSVD